MADVSKAYTGFDMESALHRCDTCICFAKILQQFRLKGRAIGQNAHDFVFFLYGQSFKKGICIEAHIYVFAWKSVSCTHMETTWLSWPK